MCIRDRVVPSHNIEGDDAVRDNLNHWDRSSRDHLGDLAGVPIDGAKDLASGKSVLLLHHTEVMTDNVAGAVEKSRAPNGIYCPLCRVRDGGRARGFMEDWLRFGIRRLGVFGFISEVNEVNVLRAINVLNLEHMRMFDASPGKLEMSPGDRNRRERRSINRSLSLRGATRLGRTLGNFLRFLRGW